MSLFISISRRLVFYVYTWDAGENCIGFTVYQCRVYCVSLAITQALLGSLSCVSSVDELCTFDVQALQ